MITDISVAVRWDPVNQQELDDYDYDGGNNSSRLFERSRIKALADEREAVQKKTFCKWVNSHLVPANCRITDLYTDLRDGKMLIKLLEILSGERLPEPDKGKMRFHCLENVDKALQFLKDQRVHLENLGSHDIVDGNPRLTLGLIWIIILRFQIQDITIEDIENQETKSAKDALLLWCQMKTAGYPNVNIRNFTTSWRDGLAFNAIIHKHRPDLIQYDKLSKYNAMHNLNNAFTTAEQNLGLTRLLDAEDVYVEKTDEKSIITYVVTYYHYFSKMKAETVQGRRIGKVVGLAMENDQLIEEYETLTSDLLQWIEQTTNALSDRKFANSLTGVQQQLSPFNNYRTAEKPPKSTRLQTFPDFSVPHLKKFTIGDNWVPKKLDISIDVPDELDLSSLRGKGLQPGEEELPQLLPNFPQAADPIWGANLQQPSDPSLLSEREDGTRPQKSLKMPQEDDHQRSDIHFKHLSSSPNHMEVETAEEDEVAVFMHRATLFKYDDEKKEWEEVGVGDLKIFKDVKKLRFRVILRRDQVHEIACNHWIDPNMKLSDSATSDSALCWKALDYSEGHSKTCQFAIRFKTKALLEEFRKIFNECRELLKQSESSIQTVSNMSEDLGMPHELQIRKSQMKKAVKISNKCEKEEKEGCSQNWKEHYLSAAEMSILKNIIPERTSETMSGIKEEKSLYSTKRFEEFYIPANLLRGIYNMGYNVPSIFQEITMPLLLRNPPRNMIVQGKSGTGKTAAYLIPCLARICTTEEHPQIIILASAYELALQIGEVAMKMAKFCTDITFQYAVKGARPEIRQMMKQHIIIGTPGTIYDWTKKYKYINMEKIKIFVLDEADLLLSFKGHKEHCICIIKQLTRHCQILLFSATYTEEVIDFAKQIISDPIVIRLSREEETLENVHQYFIKCESPESKYNAIQNIYGAFSVGQTIIFCHSKRTAWWIGQKLLGDGHSVGYLFNDLSVTERIAVISSFREGKEKILITSNMCARGINIEQVSVVINFDLPVTLYNRADCVTYLHRIGRTGRFSRRGIAVNFVCNEQDKRVLQEIEQYFGKKIDEINAECIDDLAH